MSEIDFNLIEMRSSQSSLVYFGAISSADVDQDYDAIWRH